jgi:hypothetical protein
VLPSSFHNAAPFFVIGTTGGGRLYTLFELKVTSILQGAVQVAGVEMVAVGPGAAEAEQLALEPPHEPLHDQFQGPEPLTEEAEPEEQRLAVGAEEKD